jgi:histidine triad (HIT) family protein
LEPDKIADLRVKQLEMIQAIIGRVSSHGATLKNFCITLTTAVCGFAVTLGKPSAALLSLPPILVFALLDAQYLRIERRFRRLFDQVRAEDWTSVPTFAVGLDGAPDVPFGRTLRSWSIIIFYGPLALAVVFVVLVAGHIYGRLPVHSRRFLCRADEAQSVLLFPFR